MMNGYGMMAGMGWLGMLTMLLFWVGILALVVWGLLQLFTARPNSSDNDPFAIARHRLARGEINRDEYQQIVETLQGS